MLANVSAEFATQVSAVRHQRQAEKDAGETRKAEQHRLTRNLAEREWSAIVADLQACCVPKYVKGKLTYLLNGGAVWDRFHGQDYRDLIDDESDRTMPSQFLSGVVKAIKGIVADSFEAADSAELSAIMEVLANTEAIGFRSAPAVTRTIHGDYQVKADLRARYVTRATVTA